MRGCDITDGFPQSRWVNARAELVKLAKLAPSQNDAPLLAMVVSEPGHRKQHHPTDDEAEGPVGQAAAVRHPLVTARGPARAVGDPACRAVFAGHRARVCIVLVDWAPAAPRTSKAAVRHITRGAVDTGSFCGGDGAVLPAFALGTRTQDSGAVVLSRVSASLAQVHLKHCCAASPHAG